ncbi:MAG TPA: hypothetical protein VMH81_23655 [Bryobacteraceae bacterium]|nr:hypothetical protein [Bryobacteraceae bacterium]
MKRFLHFSSVVVFVGAFTALSAQQLGTDKNQLNFSAQSGGPAVTQTLNVTGSGTFTTFPNTSWLHVNPQNGTAPSALTVSADPTGLAAGVYGGTLSIFGASNRVDVQVNLTVSSISVSPASLAFEFQTGGTAPPAQNLTLSGPLTSYSATATSSGNWLQISTGVGAPSATISGTSPGTITASVNFTALAVLPPGTAGGSIVITPVSGSAITVPVSVLVLNAPQVTVSPASVSLAYQIGGTNNSAQQSVTISTNAISGISYTVVPTVNNNPAGRVWFTVAPSTIGTIPANGSTSLTISYDQTANLPPGTYTGKATLQTPAGTPASQDIPVTLLVSNSPLLSLSNSTLNFTYQLAGAAPASQNVTVNSTSGATALSLSATTANNSGNWLTVPATATAGTAFPVAVNPSGLAPGNYSGTITVTASGAANSPLQITVNLKVTNDPVIVYVANGCSTATFSTCPVVFPVQIGQNPQPAQAIRVTSSTGTSLNYTASTQVTSCGGNWLVIGGATSGGTDGLFSAAVVTTGIAAGTTCSGAISISAANPATGAAAPNSPLLIPVTLYVSSTPQLVVSPSALTFMGQLNGPTAPQQAVTLFSTSSTDSLTYNVSFSTANNSNWLFVSPVTGVAGAAGTGVTVLASPGILSAGTYTGTITITATGPGGATVADSPVTIPVFFEVNAGTISATPTTSLNFTQVAGGQAPASQPVSVSGTPNPINFTVTAAADNGGTWLSATPTSGTTPGTVQVSASAGNLAVGSYTGKVTITAATPPGATGSPIVIPVTLNVVAAQTLTASPNNVSFSYIMGTSNPANQTVAVSSTGGAAPFTASISPSTATWLSVTPTSGNTPQNLTFAANPTGLAAGKYTATVSISSTSSLSPTTVTVTLTVSTPVPPVVTSVNNAASYSTGGVSPGENIVIFGTGLGPATLVPGTVTNNVWNNSAGGVQVLFDGVAAPVIYASAQATSVMVPYGVAGRTSTNIVVSYQGVMSSPIPYNVVQAAPGIYSLNASGTGPGAILNQDFSVNGPANPATANSVVAIYMTGEGVTVPASTDGALAPVNGTGLNKPPLTVTATVAGMNAVVEYFGSAPGIIYGVMQVNIQIPANAPSGAQALIIKLTNANGTSFTTQTGITVSVK